MKSKVLALILMWVSTFAFSQTTQNEMPESKSELLPGWEKNHLFPNQMTSTNTTTDSVNTQYTTETDWYLPGSNPELPMTNSLNVRNNSNPKSHPDDLSFQQIITTSSGWSGLSSYVVPDDLSVEEIFAPYSDQLIIIYSMQGTYFPSQQINTLGNWNPASGYIAKFAEPADIEISGQINQNRKVDLAFGWNLIPVLSTCPVDVVSFFRNKNVRVVKEVSGFKLYWPEMGINSLGELMPGKAYYVLMGGSESVLYPNCGLQNWQCGDPLIDTRDNQSYKTVQIGEQCWFADNLNTGLMIDVADPMTNNGIIEKYCQNNSSDSCNVYGGLYQWNELMKYTSGTKGICPSGWHVSTNEDLIELTEYLGGWEIAGDAMKETGYRHWQYPNSGSTNSSGFTALPGGFTEPSGSIYPPGGYCDFWVSTSDTPENAMRWFLMNGQSIAGHAPDYPKDYGFSVRCVRDTVPSEWSCGDPIIDTRDNQSYNTVQIGDQCWMAENINVGTIINGTTQTDNNVLERYCYENSEAICDIYGGLYEWPEAMQYSTSGGAQGICPEGWQIPKDGDWLVLDNFLGGAAVAGGKMKSTGTIEQGTGLWYAPNTAATNESGFSGLPGGFFAFNNCSYLELGNTGYFWSSSQYTTTGAFWHGLYSNSAGVDRQAGNGTNGFSVRCIKACLPEPTQSDAGSDQLGITGTSTILAGNTPANGTGFWTVISGTGGTIITPTSPTSEFQGVEGNEYILAWTITTDCGSSSDHVVISFGIVSFICGNSLHYEGQSYATIQIGLQCWMAENLNVGTQVNPYEQSNNGIIEKLCFENNPANCDEYGGLYEWNEMMNYSTNQTNQGICPEGWRVPELPEWESLISYLGGSSVAGGKMKEAGFTHWDEPNTEATNESGFRALGGGRYSDGYGLLNQYANFWTSFFNGEDQLQKFVQYNSGSVETGYAYYEYQNANSVRCIKDIEPQTWSCGDPIIDTRDNLSYNTVQIGDQCWMAENLNVGSKIQTDAQPQANEIIEKYCYENSEEYCNEYGGLYTWPEMMQYVSEPGSQGICPEGFHIPDDEEWITLSNTLGGGGVAGGKLKETGTTHWLDPNTGATNESGFTGLGSGFCMGFSMGLTASSYIWSSTIAQPGKAWYRYLSSTSEIFYRANTHGMTSGFSVRCIKN